VSVPDARTAVDDEIGLRRRRPVTRPHPARRRGRRRGRELSRHARPARAAGAGDAHGAGAEDPARQARSVSRRAPARSRGAGDPRPARLPLGGTAPVAEAEVLRPLRGRAGRTLRCRLPPPPCVDGHAQPVLAPDHAGRGRDRRALAALSSTVGGGRTHRLQTPRDRPALVRDRRHSRSDRPRAGPADPRARPRQLVGGDDHARGRRTGRVADLGDHPARGGDGSWCPRRSPSRFLPSARS
jgi:hypothetical protein